MMPPQPQPPPLLHGRRAWISPQRRTAAQQQTERVGWCCLRDYYRTASSDSMRCEELSCEMRLACPRRRRTRQ